MGERSVVEWITEAEENEGLPYGEWMEFIAAVKKEKKESDEEFKKLQEVGQTRREMYRNQYNENLRLNKEKEKLLVNLGQIQEDVGNIDLEGIAKTIEGLKQRIEDLNLALQGVLDVH